MIKLLYITTNLNSSGGVARVLSLKLNYLVEKYDYDVAVINSNGDNSNLFFKFDKRIKIYSLNQHYSKIKRFLTYKTKLNNLIFEINPDVIVNCDDGLKGALLPYILSGKFPLIFESHRTHNALERNILENLKLKFRNFFFSKSINKYKRIVVYKHLEKVWKSKNIRVIHNPLAFEIPKKSSSLNNRIVLAVGRLSYVKGYDKLIDIWALVVEKHPDWKLHIYGEGDRLSLLKQVKKMNLINNISFFNPVSNIKDVYLNASILVNTSRHEAFGLALIEAMACGLPVLAFSNTLGPRIYIKHKENGFLIKKDDMAGYANQIIELIEDKDKMQSIGKNAKISIKKYEISNIMEQWHQLFQSI